MDSATSARLAKGQGGRRLAERPATQPEAAPRPAGIPKPSTAHLGMLPKSHRRRPLDRQADRLEPPPTRSRRASEARHP